MTITGPVYTTGVWAWAEVAILAAIAVGCVTVFALVIVEALRLERELRKLDRLRDRRPR